MRSKLGRVHHWIVTGCVAVTLACGDAPTAPVTLTGDWRGVATVSGHALLFAGLLVESDGSLSGAGTVSWGTVIDCLFTASGQRSNASVTVQMLCDDGVEVVTFRGTVLSDGRTLSGTVDSSQWIGRPYTITRR